MKKIILRIILVLLIFAIVVFYIYDLKVNQTAPTQHLFRTLSIVFLCLASLARTFTIRNRNSLSFYEEQYSDILTNAFSEQPFWRKKLLCAVRLYNEGNYPKATKYLTDLKQYCRNEQDVYAVFLFAALCFTDMGMYDTAQSIYQSMINAEIVDSRIFSNLGQVHIKAGEYQKALQCYHHALDYDKSNAYAHNNIAWAHFKMHEFDKAISYAMKALEIKPQLHQASALLTIIYALTGDKENMQKYFHISISNGRDPDELKESIEYYQTSQHAGDEAAEIS